MFKKLGHISCRSIVAIVCVTFVCLMKFTLKVNIFINYGQRKGFFVDPNATL